MSYSILNSGLDWFTATTKKDKVGQAWYEACAKHWAKVEDTFDSERKDWRNRWYNGLQAGGLAWGYKEQLGYIVIARSSLAHQVWLDFLPIASRVTRIDIQVTIGLDEPRSDLVEAMYQKNRTNRQRNYAVILNSRNGKTLYVGSRHSDQFGRLYDKGVQESTRTAEGLDGAIAGSKWRYEVQVNKPRADPLVASLIDQVQRGDDVTHAVLSRVYQWFRARGVPPVFSAETGQPVIEVEKKITTTERKLSWLRTQVKPTVQRLIESGLHCEALDALGLDWKQVEFLHTGEVKSDD